MQASSYRKSCHHSSLGWRPRLSSLAMTACTCRLARSFLSPCAAPCSASPALASSARAQAPPPRRRPIASTFPANDDGLPGMGPLRRYAWFRKLWHDKRTKWATRGAAGSGRRRAARRLDHAGLERAPPAAFPGMKVANRGISGDTTRGVLLRLQEDVIALNPKARRAADRHQRHRGRRPPRRRREQHAADPRRRCANTTRSMPIVLCQVFPSSAKMKRPSPIIKDINARLLALVKNDPQVTPGRHLAPLGDSRRRRADRRVPRSAAPQRRRLRTLGRGPASGARVARPDGAPVPSRSRSKPASSRCSTAATSPAGAIAPTTEQEKVVGGEVAGVRSQCGAVAVRHRAGQLRRPHRQHRRRWRVVGDRHRRGHAGRSSASISQLWTTKSFEGDFVLKLEFRATPNADGGVFLRGPQLQVRDYRLAGPVHDAGDATARRTGTSWSSPSRARPPRSPATAR